MKTLGSGQALHLRGYTRRPKTPRLPQTTWITTWITSKCFNHYFRTRLGEDAGGVLW